MTNLVTVLALAEKAREDIYFAGLEREQIAAIRAGRLHPHAPRPARADRFQQGPKADRRPSRP